MSQTPGSKRSRHSITQVQVAPASGEQKENRDPNGLNQHVKADFYEVLAEPAGVRSPDCTWDMSETLYSCFKDCCYKLFTCLCGCCIAIYWALEFVPVIFAHVWCLTPAAQCFKIICGYWVKSFWVLCFTCMCSPIARSISPFFRFLGNGTKRMDTPSIFPKYERRPKPVAAPVVVKVDTPPPAEKSEWEDYDKEKIAKSVKRQLMMF